MIDYTEFSNVRVNLSMNNHHDSYKLQQTLIKFFIYSYINIL